MITKEEFDSLYSDSITKKEYDAIIAKIDERFEEICEKFLHPIRGSNHAWYDYGNCNGMADDNRNSGFFDPKLYFKTINIYSDLMDIPRGY